MKIKRRAKGNLSITRKILVINPNTCESMTNDIRFSAESVKHPETEMTYVNSLEGPETIETYFDEALASIGVLRIMVAEREHYDAFIIACGDDPGLPSAREITDKPIVPIGQAPMLIAPLLGRKFSILGTWLGDKARSEEKVARYRLSGLLASVVPCGEAVLRSHRKHNTLLTHFETIGRRAIEEDGAEVLIITCAGLAGLHLRLQDLLGVPVLEGISCAVKLAELLIDLGLKSAMNHPMKWLPDRKGLKGFKEFQKLEFFK